MGESVEARSLAALNELASNPPKYPTRPHETKQDPLILYISRVPGTRDVILSTLKPQVKNVTAGDVASSFYYVHYQSHKDDPLAALKKQASSSPRSSGETSRIQIPRKPLPATASQATSGIAAAPTAPYGKENQGNALPTRPPVRVTTPGESLENRPLTPTRTGLRSPLSPKSPIDRARHKPLPPMPSAALSPSSDPPHVGDQVPSLPLRPGNRRGTAGSADSSSVAPEHAASPYNFSTKRHYTPFSLTLIRRDPSSGQQWNVGKIASFQLENPDAIEDEKRHQASPSIQIHIETSGYAKFRGMPTASELSVSASLDMHPGSASSASMLQKSHDIISSMPASGMFERQVKMTYSPSFTASLRNQFRRHSSIDEGPSASPTRHHGHSRESSQVSIGSIGGEFDGSETPIITQPAPGLKARGYMFFSPWNGRCEFMTGNVGRSLKCRHVPPSYGGGVYNPLVEGSNGDHHGDEKADSTRPISELRFNLPRNETSGDKRSAEGGMRARDQIQSQFNKMVAKAQGLDDSDESEFHFDLNIGREKAGGGNRGRRAKMGKLIIFDEGLKMLDLTIAANVGIWWTTWERTFEH